MSVEDRFRNGVAAGTPVIPQASEGEWTLVQVTGGARWLDPQSTSWSSRHRSLSGTRCTTALTDRSIRFSRDAGLPPPLVDLDAVPFGDL